MRSVLALLTTVLVLGQPAAPAGAGVPEGGGVDVFVGSGGHAPWRSGNTTPAAARPFGMLQLGPDTTRDVESGSPSRTASGYAWSDDRVRGFSPTHLPGAGCPAFGDVPVLPVVGRLPADPGAATVPFSHDDESAGPGWYRTRLGNGVGVRLAADLRAGLASYRFPAGGPARLLLKASGSLTGATRTRVRFPSRREVAVSATSGHFCGSDTTYRVHVALRFDRPYAARGSWAGATPGAWVRFDTSARRSVRTRVAVSFVDVAGARRNLARADLGWSWRRLRDEAVAEWDRELGRVRTTGGTLEDTALLGSALRRVLLSPMTLSDADRRYPGFDGRVHRVRRGERHYTALAGWDAYRTHLPLLAWLRPDVASDVVSSLQRAAEERGWMPRWPLVAMDTGVMNGDSAAPMAAAAHAFGARDFPLRRVVGQLVRQAEQTGGNPGPGGLPRPALADYLRLGYVPNTAPERGWPQPHGASTTLEYAVDDFAVARLATAAGRHAVAERLHRRSASWRALLDPERGLLLPRDAEGAFPPADYDPAGCCHGFQEGNALQYTWSGVPHDMAGLLAGAGPPDEVLARLTDFHAHLNTSAGRPNAWLGNQPSFPTPWAYLWLGEPARTQDVVDRARRELWSLTPEGLAGNDDLGSMSAWYVWASLGLYPLTPGTANLGLGVPAFDEVVVTPAGGTPTRIVRVGGAGHVASARVDGVGRTESWLRFGPAVRPRRIVVVTTPEERPAWGTAASDRPPSYPDR